MRASEVSLGHTLAEIPHFQVCGRRCEINTRNRAFVHLGVKSSLGRGFKRVFESFYPCFRVARDGEAYSHSQFQTWYDNDSTWWEEAWPLDHSGTPLTRLLKRSGCEMLGSELQSQPPLSEDHAVQMSEQSAMSACVVSHTVADVEVIEECCHVDKAASVDAGDSSTIVDLMWADFIERRIALESRSESASPAALEFDSPGDSSNFSAITWASCDDANSVLSDAAWTTYLHKPWEPSKVHLITFTRSPPSLFSALHKGRELECVRVTAAEYGQSCRLPSGTSIFVYPKHYEGVKELASGLGLLPYHAVVCEAFLPLVYAEIAKLRSKDNVRIRKLQKMALVDSSDEVIFCFLRQTFMHTFDSREITSAQGTQSTSQVHGIPNHRRSV
uniref:Uncharacterized protein n=1 Tax=Pyrodinium bahamense TaxID=73915 RepID=A0A7S0FWY7_9DINO